MRNNKIMKIKEINLRIMKLLKIKEIYGKIIKIMKVLEVQANPDNHEHLRNPYENHKNH